MGFLLFISVPLCPTSPRCSDRIDLVSFTFVYSGVNAGKAPAPEQRVRFLLGPVGDREEKALTLTATSVPTLTNHPLGKAHSGRGLGVTSQAVSAESVSQSVLRLLSQILEGPQWG